jgi:hypothetical protein
MSKADTSTEDVLKGGDEKLIERSNYPTASNGQRESSVFGLFKDGRM